MLEHNISATLSAHLIFIDCSCCHGQVVATPTIKSMAASVHFNQLCAGTLAMQAQSEAAAAAGAYVAAQSAQVAQQAPPMAEPSVPQPGMQQGEQLWAAFECPPPLPLPPPIDVSKGMVLQHHLKPKRTVDACGKWHWRALKLAEAVLKKNYLEAQHMATLWKVVKA